MTPNYKSDPVYSQDWFSSHIDHWREWLSGLQGQPELQFLEIGCFEGRATRWLLENILTHPSAHIYCLDINGLDSAGKLVQDRFMGNIQPFQSKVSLFTYYSQIALRSEPSLFYPNFFDFIYIDGSHRANDVLEDAVLSFRILKEGGILVFDDYGLEMFPEPKMNPKLAIDAWLACYSGQYDLIHKDWQVCVIKRAAQDNR